VRIDVITIFPGMFGAVLGESMMRLAQEKGLVEVRIHDLRDYSEDAHRKVDDRPYGGGPGMVMRVDPIVRAVRKVVGGGPGGAHVVLTSPGGRRFSHGVAGELATRGHLVFIAGHYEGIDARVSEILQPDEISLGDFVLTGGELPAMVMIDAVVRLLPGVLGAAGGAADDSFADGLLEAPQYTRPIDFEGHRVPAVLRGGNHAEIAEYRRRQSLRRTVERRPDLLEGHGDEPRS
jgi:tRNA (guanine37-N1)-methyltransferase